MSEAAYTVRAEFEDGTTADRFVDWLAGSGDHAARVLAHGGVRAEVVRLDAERPVIECRYVFRDRELLEAYLRDHAPALRAEGLRAFPSGVVFTRSIGRVVARVVPA